MAEPFRSFASAIVPLTAENVDTDQIVPARYLKVTDKEGLAEALFRDYRFNEDGTKKDPPWLLDRPEMQGRKILLAGDNFGTGSSREHAPWALRSWGIRAILSTSFADIFKSNALKNGVLPIVVDPATHAALFEMVEADPDAELRVDLAEQGILLPDGTTLDFDVDPFSKMMLMAGTDEIGYVMGKDAGDRGLGGGPPAPGGHAHRDRGRRVEAGSGDLADTRRVEFNPNLYDLIAILVLVLAVLAGIRTGALPQVGGIGGAVTGLLVMLNAAPWLLDVTSGLEPIPRALARPGRHPGRGHPGRGAGFRDRAGDRRPPR